MTRRDIAAYSVCVLHVWENVFASFPMFLFVRRNFSAETRFLHGRFYLDERRSETRARRGRNVYRLSRETRSRAVNSTESSKRKLCKLQRKNELLIKHPPAGRNANISCTAAINRDELARTMKDRSADRSESAFVQFWKVRVR